MASLKEVGDRVGPYRLVDVLGVGGSGQVFKAVFDPGGDGRHHAPADHPRAERGTDQAPFNERRS